MLYIVIKFNYRLNVGFFYYFFYFSSFFFGFVSSPHLQFTRSTHIIISLSLAQYTTPYYTTHHFFLVYLRLSSCLGRITEDCEVFLKDLFHGNCFFFNSRVELPSVAWLVVAPWLPHKYFLNSLSLSISYDFLLYMTSSPFSLNLKQIWHSNLKYTILHILYIHLI